MKNTLLVILILAVLGMGGWIAYDKLGKDTDKTVTNAGATSSAGSEPVAPQPTGKTVDLSNSGLTEVGPSIYNQTDTVVLILSNNKLKSLKSEMGKMTRLEVLKLDHNIIDGSLIGEIRKMPLKTLDASYNNMTGIPAEIGQLNQLQTLDYSYNKIDTYPNEIANLKQLKTLNLTGNPFSAAKIAEIRAKLPNATIVF